MKAMWQAFGTAVLLFSLAGSAWGQGIDELIAKPIDTMETEAAELDEAALRKQADTLKEGIEQTEDEIKRLEAQLETVTAEDEKAPIQKQVSDGEARVKAASERLQVLVSAMKKLGVEDLADYQILLTKTTGLKLDNVSVDAAVGLLDEWLSRGQEWLVDKAPGIVVNVLVFLLILFAFKILAGIAGKIIEKSLKVSRLQVSDLLKNFFVNIATKAVFFVGLIMGLQVIGVPVGPLLAGVGVLGFVVGFALQDTLANFASGIMILLYRPYDIGHYVTAGGVSGTVKAMSLVSTTLFTPDNQVEVVPNGKIWGDVITNVSANKTRRVDLTVGIGYEDDIDHAEKVLLEVISSHPMVLKDPEPVVRLHNLGDSSVDFVVRPWCRTSDYWAVYWELTKGIKQRLDKEGIAIPYPQRDIHIVSGGAAEAGAKPS